MVVSSQFDVRTIGRHLSRRKRQKGQLRNYHHGKRLPRGVFQGRWRAYEVMADGSQQVRRLEKIIDRMLGLTMGFTYDYPGPITKTDARLVLAKLIADSESGVKPTISVMTTVEQAARKYLKAAGGQWDANTYTVNANIVEKHIIGKLGRDLLVEVDSERIQNFFNEYVYSSPSLTKKIATYTRAIFAFAVEKDVIRRNPATKAKAKSKKAECELEHTWAECAAVLSQLSGANRLAVRIDIQMGLRSEELFALRRNDVRPGLLVIDEAIVGGAVKATKTEESDGVMPLTPDLQLELDHFLETSVGEAGDSWLFPSSKKNVPMLPENFLKRILKPAAMRAKVALGTTKKGDVTSDITWQSLRRTSATLFGSKAKDPKLTQGHMRHTDPTITLKKYQKVIPAEARAAALAVEAELNAAIKKVAEENAKKRVH